MKNLNVGWTLLPSGTRLRMSPTRRAARTVIGSLRSNWVLFQTTILRQRERSLFEVLLPDEHKLWPDWLRKIDTLLEDEAIVEVVAQGLEARWPHSRRPWAAWHAGRDRDSDADAQASVRLEL